MKNLKKLALWMMLLVLVFSLAACGEKEEDDSKSDRNDRVEEREDDDEDEEESKEEDESKAEEDDAKDKEDADVDASKEDESKDSEDKDVVAEPEGDEVDAEFLIGKVVEVANGNLRTQSTSNMEMEMSIAIEDVTIDMRMTSVKKEMMQMNPFTAYSTTEMIMESMGQQQTVVTESYIVTEDGNLVTYSYDGSTDSWSKMDTGMSEAEMVEAQTTGYNCLKEKPISDYVVDTQLHNIGGRDAYKIEFTLTGEEMNQSINGMAGLSDMWAESGLGDLDMSNLTVPTIYYIDAETYQIIQTETNVEGMGEWMNDMMSSLLGADAATAGYQMEINIGKCYMICTDISYEPVEIPELPAEATGAQDIMDPEVSVDPGMTEIEPGTTGVQPENGVYTIEESGISAQVTCPEGWTVTYTAYDTLDIENEETWQEAEFIMYVDVTREDFVSYVEDMVVPEVQQYDIYISHGAGPEIGSFETMEVLGDGLNFYFAWAPVGEGWIMVSVSEFEGLSLEEALPPILELVDLGNVL